MAYRNFWGILLLFICLSCDKTDIDCDDKGLVCQPSNGVCTDSVTVIPIPTEANQVNRSSVTSYSSAASFQYKGFVIRTEDEYYAFYQTVPVPSIDFCQYTLLLTTVQLPGCFTKTDSLSKRCTQYTHTVTLTRSVGGCADMAVEVTYALLVSRIAKCDEVMSVLVVK